MIRNDHPLCSPSLGSSKTLTSLHFGPPRSAEQPLLPKVYIQASLHADELPAALVAHHLRDLLAQAESCGVLRGEVVLVPLANPIGLAQRLSHKPMGRFEFDSAENFNRHYPNLAAEVLDAVAATLDAHAPANVQRVRCAVTDWLARWQPQSELQSLRRSLLTLAHDADWVLDLHCDCEAVLHFYTEQPCWPQLAPLAHGLGAQAILLARNSGSHPFDECLSGLWWELAERLAARGVHAPLTQACCSTTIELRGELDVRHDLARADAQAIAQWLQHIGIWHSPTPPAAPPASAPATPLAGSQTLRAPCPGVLVFSAQVGQRLRAGDPVAELIDPRDGRCTPVCAGVDGVFYARVRDRYLCAGGEIGKIAGATAFRSGELLGA